MTTLELSAADLRPGDQIVAWRHGNGPIRPKRDWIVKCSLGPHPRSADSRCIQMEKLPGHPNYDLNLWYSSSWTNETRFYVARS